MTEIVQNEHDTIVINQFSRQAIPFAKLPGHLDSIEMLIEMSELTKVDVVLDVACGPGLVACEFAKIAQHVTGIDLTENMINQAKNRQKAFGLANLSWDIGTAYPLPYSSDSFSVVVTRYSFHHYLNPKDVLKEMMRVCKPKGMILIADVALPVNKVYAYNTMEKLRDPSHTKALSREEWKQLLTASGLHNLRHANYKVAMELETQLKASFPNPGDDEKIREIFRNDTNTNSLGMNAQWLNGEIHFSYPISIYAGRK